MTIIKTFDTEENKNKFPKRYIVMTIIGLFVLTIIEIWASNTAVAFGERFEQLSVSEKALRMENQILSNEIAEKASLLNIASQSAELGFSTAQSIQYIR